MNSGRIITMAVTGAVVGAGLGYLFFTKSGKETLDKLMQGTGSFREKIMTGIGNSLAGMTRKVRSDKTDKNDKDVDFSREAAAPVS